jgi:DNA-binding NtrC family response regulator
VNSGSRSRRERLTPAQRPRVLIVDDERSVRLALRRYFERSGWQVEEAEDGARALTLLERPEASAYRLVITDLRMAGAHRARSPRLARRRTAGSLRPPHHRHRRRGLAEIQAFIQRTTRPVLEKPFELSALAAVVERVVGR